MPLPLLHEIKTAHVPTSDPNACKYQASCSCNWQALAHTADRLDSFIAGHSFSALGRSHRVIIDRGGIEKPSVVDATE